jgi:hypothetical protein
MSSDLTNPHESTDCWYRSAKAAVYIDRSVRTLADWRCDPSRNRGPKYRRVHGRVYYRKSDLGPTWVPWIVDSFRAQDFPGLLFFSQVQS